MDDLISRKALLAEITAQRAASKTSFPKRSFVVGDVIRCVNAAPAVEDEPVKHGRWDKRYEGCFNPYACSVCGSCVQHKLKYCPNCGAKMDLED